MSDKIVVDVLYSLGHTYRRTLVPADCFCPSCANRGVWVEEESGDYYVGPCFYCDVCGCEFTMQGPTPYGGRMNEAHEQTVKALRTAKTGDAE